MSLTFSTLCWRSSGSASASTMRLPELLLLVAVLVSVAAAMAAAVDEEVSSPPPSAVGELGSRHGLDGMIPADLAARSMAPERATIQRQNRIRADRKSDSRWNNIRSVLAKAKCFQDEI